MKEIRPIKTEIDYEEALTEIEVLFEAKPGTPEADRLEILTTLVEAYEEKHCPIPPPDPVEAIKFRIDNGTYKKPMEDRLHPFCRDTECWYIFFH